MQESFAKRRAQKGKPSRPNPLPVSESPYYREATPQERAMGEAVFRATGQRPKTMDELRETYARLLGREEYDPFGPEARRKRGRAGVLW
jgi:hypothetical protein